MEGEIQPGQGSPSILLVDDSPTFRRYLRSAFEGASWKVREWDPQAHPLDEFSHLSLDSLTAALVDHRLGKAPFSGLEVLKAVRAKSDQTACLLYTNYSVDWPLQEEQASRADVLALRPGNFSPAELYARVVQEVRRRRPTFREPREMSPDLSPWIQPAEPGDDRLKQVVDAIGSDQLALMIQAMFPERGAHRPVRYSFVTPGYSGAHVVLVADADGTPNPGARYVLKLSSGSEGFRGLQTEHRRFHDLILGAALKQPKLFGYVARELRPAATHPEPQSAGEWFGIAYQEIGNGSGRILQFQDHYVEVDKIGPADAQSRSLELFLDRLYFGCFGPSCHCLARERSRPLWGPGKESEACYWLSGRKRHEIFSALVRLTKRAGQLLGSVGEPKDTKSLESTVVSFLDNGRTVRPPTEPTLYQRTFRVLSAGTHGDLHAGNVLASQHRDGGEFAPFVIDFSEYDESGHPFCDYARLESDIRLRLMNSEDGSDVLAELLPRWLREEEALDRSLGEATADSGEPTGASGPATLTQKGYRLIWKIRALAYQNLVNGLHDQTLRPLKHSFRAQYIAALLHRTLISLASTDIVETKKILGLWLAARLIAQLGEAASRITA